MQRLCRCQCTELFRAALPAPSWGRDPGAGASKDQPSRLDVADGDQLGTVMEERIKTLCLTQKKEKERERDKDDAKRD